MIAEKNSLSSFRLDSDIDGDPFVPEPLREIAVRELSALFFVRYVVPVWVTGSGFRGLVHRIRNPVQPLDPLQAFFVCSFDLYRFRT